MTGCHISLISSTYSSNISLMCSPVCSSTVIGCTYDLPSDIMICTFNVVFTEVRDSSTGLNPYKSMICIEYIHLM